MFEGAGTPVFGNIGKDKTHAINAGKNENVNENKDGETENQSNTGDENYDPYFEPIVPLPDVIVVKTGEEDEEVIFIERAKLYRFSEEQWKERGIGQIKILHHPIKGKLNLIFFMTIYAI